MRISEKTTCSNLNFLSQKKSIHEGDNYKNTVYKFDATIIVKSEKKKKKLWFGPMEPPPGHLSVKVNFYVFIEKRNTNLFPEI